VTVISRCLVSDNRCHYSEPWTRTSHYQTLFNSHYSVKSSPPTSLTGRMPFPSPNQWRHITEGFDLHHCCSIIAMPGDSATATNTLPQTHTTARWPASVDGAHPAEFPCHVEGSSFPAAAERCLTWRCSCPPSSVCLLSADLPASAVGLSPSHCITSAWLVHSFHIKGEIYWHFSLLLCRVRQNDLMTMWFSNCQ